MASTRRTFRPWLWNLVVAAISAMFAAALVGVVVTEEVAAARIIYAAFGLGFVALAVRVWGQRVVAGPEGIVVHGIWRTLRIGWDDVAEVAYRQAGERLLQPTWAPVLVLRQPSGGDGRAEVVLDCVRSFRSGVPGRSLAERTVQGLRHQQILNARTIRDQGEVRQ